MVNKNQTELRPEERFALDGARGLERDPDVLAAGLLPAVRESLRRSFFTQYVDDYDFNEDGIGLKTFVIAYRTGDEVTRRAVRKSLDCINAQSPYQGATFILSYMGDAISEISRVDASEKGELRGSFRLQASATTL